MKIIKGKYAEAVIYTDMVEDMALRQVKDLCDQPFVAGSIIRMMPDIHAGKGCVIGTTMTITDKVCPNLVGVDIGCGMETVILQERNIDFMRLDRVVRESVPAGMNIFSSPVPEAEKIEEDIDALLCPVKRERVLCSLATLGGGNHFIEVDRDEDGTLYLIIHSGSRSLGTQIASFYQRMAVRDGKRLPEGVRESLIEELKAQGRQREISETLEEEKDRLPDIPVEFACIEGDRLSSYLHDMKIGQKYATLSRRTMADRIMEKAGLHAADRFETIHNYIDFGKGILRKGSVSAEKGERLLIPVNMRDGSLLCVGKGNKEWNFSAPHGAGRRLSRSAAKAELSVEEFQKQMEGIYSTSVSEETLDEAPMAYKSAEDIVSNIGDTCEVAKVLKPVYNFKA